MRLFRVLRLRVRSVFRGSRVEQDLHDELRDHLERQIELHAGAGMSPAEARRAAIRDFGNLPSIHEQVRDTRRVWWLSDVHHDVVCACRAIRRAPGFAAIVVGTLALAIGANTAIFSVVHSTLLRPLPYPDADRLVRVYGRESVGPENLSVSIDTYVNWKRQAMTLDALEAFEKPGIDGSFVDRETGASLAITAVSRGLLGLLGARPSVGRLLADYDMRPDAAPVAVLSHEFWIARFGGDRDVVGSSIGIAERDEQFGADVIERLHTIIGVLEPMDGPLLDDVQVVLPLAAERDLDRRGSGLNVLGRLRQDVTSAASRAELMQLGTAVGMEWPGVSVSPVLVPLGEDVASRSGTLRSTLFALQAATVLIVVIAVCNIGNLFLARGTTRRGELAVRAALGASRTRLLRLLLSESLALSLAGGAAGIAVAYAAVRLLLNLAPAWIPRLDEVAIDARVLLVALGTTVASGVAFGFAPLPGRGSLHVGSHRAGASPEDGRGWLRSGLVVAQLAVSLVLLSGGGLMVRMFAGLQAIPLGFDDRQIVAGELDHPNVYSSVGPATGVFASGRPISLPDRRRADPSPLLQRYRSVVEHVRTIPGVRDVTLASQRPLGTAYILGLEIRDTIGDGWQPVNTLQSLDNVLGVSVLENFLDFFGTRAVAGRLFDAADALRTEAVVVVDTNAAAKLWPGKAAVGQRIRMLGAEALVVGVTAPIRYGLAGRTVPTDIPPTIFFLLGRAGPFGGALLIRHEGSAAAIMPAIQARVREADSSLQLSGLEPLGTRFDRWVAEPRFQTLLLSALAFLGLVVAALGVYGVMAYAVARRTGEIGLRLALGADRRRIVALFARWNGRLLGTGLGLGLLGSLWLTQYMRALLFGTEPTDPLTFASMAALLALAALVATLAPIRRALAVDPAVTLRAE